MRKVKVLSRGPLEHPELAEFWREGGQGEQWYPAQSGLVQEMERHA